MARTLSRSLLVPFLTLGLLLWAGCTDEDRLMGPGTLDDAVAPGVVLVGTAQTYTVRDLGTLGGSWSKAYGVNGNDWVVGLSETADGSQHAFLWTEAGGMRDLNGGGFVFSQAEAVNNNGLVVGWGVLSGTIRGFTWTEETGMVSIGVPSGHSSSYLLNVNDAGKIVGTALSSLGNWNAILWYSPTNVAILGDLGGRFTKSLDINEGGRVVGVSALPGVQQLQHAVVWVPQVEVFDLGTLGGDESAAFGINELNQVVGWADDALARSRPFLWPVGSEMIDLSTLGGDEGEAYDINDAGFAVGESEATPGSALKRATLWTPDFEVVDLGSLEGGGESHGRDINAAGTVVGFAATASGDLHAALWSSNGGGGVPGTVPEMLDQLASDIDQLVADGALRKGHARGLLKKIRKANRDYERGRLNKVARTMRKFIRRVERLVKKGKLSQEDARPLIDQAQAVIDQIRAGP